MNTRNTVQNVEKKLQRAIEFLEVLQLPRTSAILEFIQENGQVDATELIIRFPEGDLQYDLDKMVETGILFRSESFYQPTYQINREKLMRVFRATSPVFKIAVGIDAIN